MRPEQTCATALPLTQAAREPAQITTEKRELPLRELAGVLGLLAMIVGPYVSVGALAATIATEASTVVWVSLLFIGAFVPLAVLICGGFAGSLCEKALAALALVLLLLVFAKVSATYSADDANKAANEIANPGSLAGGGVEGVAALITALSGLVTSVAGCLTAWVAFKQSRDNRQPPPDSRPANPPSDGRQGNPPSDR